ncbi:guanylate-binding protein 4 isoform X2 [Camelus dromedarius]|uniref:guanylate-binding protein 4 isoform X2 n=1 Tax=Camelus dromedarius TaxID=9838 RepID=UPI003119705F
MASGPSMMNPVCLVERQNSQMTVNPNALKILDQISQPVVVVAIVGPYRTGKSYLMNRLVGQNHGFSLGSTVRAETKGIWMWCVPHPSKESHTLVLLDTEGLGDVEKGDSKIDSWTFTLAVLLSSCFVYNSMSTINHQALEQLHYVTELTNLIRTKSPCSSDDGEDSADFVSFFPDFVWTVRDFMLELEFDGHPITEDEYLENALRLIPGNDPQIQNSNMPREMIRSFFPKRKCFVFHRPVTSRKLLVHMEDVPDDQLDESFQMQCQDFCSYIFTHAKSKTLGEGITVNGAGLGTLAVAYVDTINSGAVPCLENAVMTLAEHENSAAVEKASAHYSEQMAQRVTLPTDTLQGLLEVHAACEREAIAVFMEHSFKDDKREFQKKLVANEVLHSFLQSQAGVEEAILKADKSITDWENAMAVERAQKEAAEREQELLKEKLNEQQQKLEMQERSMKENLAQLEEKMDREREDLLRQQDRLLEHMLKMQRELLRDGFKKKAKALTTQINKLKENIQRTRNKSIVAQVAASFALLTLFLVIKK